MRYGVFAFESQPLELVFGPIRWLEGCGVGFVGAAVRRAKPYEILSVHRTVIRR
jgi:hypothetical protein